MKARFFSEGLRARAAIVAINLGILIAITSVPAFEAAHHHWIFPILAALLAGQWALTLALPKNVPSFEPRAARAAILSILTFLLVMGIARHATILACYDRCALRLAETAAIAAMVFIAHRRLNDPGFWSPDRALLSAIGSLSWAGYLALRGALITPWVIEPGFAVLALLFWLRRAHAPFLIASLGIAAALAIKSTANEYLIIGLGILWGVALPLALVPKTEAWLKRRATRRSQRKTRASRVRPLPIRILLSAARIGAAVGILAAFGIYAAGPMSIVTDASKRQARLAAMAPTSPMRDLKTLSPLASRLRSHVVFLAQTVGERGVDRPMEQQRTREYILAQLRNSGYSPKSLVYQSQWLSSVPNGTQFSNVEAVLGHAPADAGGAWIIGAHYDTASTTPGADDNASGVAVLLETARLLKERRPGREVRFVAFGTEEPPAFGTRNMGSYRYARALKESGVAIHGMISLEMLGYFNPRRGSQLYPPFLHLFYPDHGDFVSVSGNFHSRGLLNAFKTAWRSGSRFPLSAALLPGLLCTLCLSDQLNFWNEGFPALMLSDTAFYRNPHYHEASDLPDTLDYEKMAEVTSALTSTIIDEEAAEGVQ